MASYATVQDAKDLYGDDYVLTSADRDANGELDTTSLTRAFAQASSEIDSYLASRYPVPLATVPALVVRHCVDIGLYQCSSGPGAGLTDEKRKRYDDAIRWLTKVAKGELGIGLEDPSGSAVGLPQVSTANPVRLFTRTTMGSL